MLAKKRMLIVALCLILLLSGCNNSLPDHGTDESNITDTSSTNEQISNDLDDHFGFDQNSYNWKYNFGVTDAVIEELADAILRGEIYVDSSIVEPYICELENIDWNVNFSQSPGTFQLYLQALNPTAYLVQAYYINNNIEYLNAARQIIESWMSYKESYGSEKNPYLWYDHGTAIRTNNLIYFLLAYVNSQQYDPDFCNQIVQLLEEHGQHLSNEAEYFENHNHGIFQDQALIYVAYFLNNSQSPEWLSLAKERVVAQKEHAFSSEMVHVENSPGYQMGVTELFYQISNFLMMQGDEFGEDLFVNVSDSLEFMAWVIKPNGILAEIGDTNSIKGVLTKVDYTLEKYNDEHLLYSSTLGQAGQAPEKISTIYPESGYYFGRSSWSSDDYSQSTWTMFKAGFSSRTHKHADDLSFMLYSKGYDILVDPGWYNYMSGSPYRDYFISSNAHNTVIVDGKSYSPTEENSYKTGIYSYNLENEWDEVIAYNNMYDGVQINRHLLYGGDAIVIIDDIVSDKEHVYSQLFHLSEYMTVESANDDEVVAAIGDSGYKLRIRQLTNDSVLNIVNGTQENAEYGFISRVMNDLEYIDTLKWNIRGGNVEFITVLTIEDTEGNVLVGKNKQLSNSKVLLDEEDHKVTFETSNGESILHWEDKENYSFANITKSIDGNVVTLENTPENVESWNYAWYLINKDSAEVVERISYSEDNSARFTIETEGTYFVKAYMRSANGKERASEIIYALKYENNELIDITYEFPFLNLEYMGNKIDKIDDNTWRFTVNYNYSWDTSISWYIYKDGGFYSSERTENINYREYQFTEPGSYTVMYYLRTSNGDNEFWNFEQVINE